jgi:hypothetical protein
VVGSCRWWAVPTMHIYTLSTKSQVSCINLASKAVKEAEEQARYKANTEKEFENLTPADFE